MVLTLKNLTLVCNGVVLLNNMNLEIERGQTTILFGKSGSGKTITTLALQGLLQKNIKKVSGELLLDDIPIDPKVSRAKVFASIMQNPRTCFNPLYSLHTHIKESANALKKNWDIDIIESMLNEVGLQKEVLKLYPFEMSGGMLQRAMIALALLTKAPFLIADEPTTDLDIIVQYRILKLLKHLQKLYGLGILLITHDMDVAIKMGNTILIIDNGSMKERIELQNNINKTPKTIMGQALIDKYIALKQNKLV